MTTITEAFVLPSRQDIQALNFVIRLDELDPHGEPAQRLVEDYVVTPAIERELPTILQNMRQVYTRGEDYGRFIHGSFGSGKSHFMTMLALLLEGAQPAWDKFGPILDAYRPPGATPPQPATLYRQWVDDANLVVVRIHMLSVRGRTTTLDRAVYDAFNDALKRRGKDPFRFLHLDAIFDEIRREADDYGEIVWKRLAEAALIDTRDDFDAIAHGTDAEREGFARLWLAHKGRSAEDAGIDPRWTEGLRQMGAHARTQGYGGIVLMIDEFLLWLGEKAGHEFVQEINNLNLIVDHNTGKRPAPVFVFVARQRNLQDFFPDLVEDNKLHAHLDHHAKRFELTQLQDVELRHIVRGRVLRPRLEDEVQQAIQEFGRTHGRIIQGLMATTDLAYLQDVYPFHPALIEMLVDVTSLMQRERSALRLLYELLVIHYPDLPLGQFLPVGSAFQALFPPAGVEASKKSELMREIHQQYYTRLKPTIEQGAHEDPERFTESRRHALDQLVRTVLLAEVSPRLRQNGLTIERLVQLNAVDIEGETFRTQCRFAEQDLAWLSQRVPELQISGTDRTAVVSYLFSRVNLSDLLQRARASVSHENSRFRVFWPALYQALGLSDAQRIAHESNSARTTTWTLKWRGTLREGRLKFGNVRTMAYDDFSTPDGTFTLLVDYPWDDPEHNVEHDRQHALKVRKNRGALYTACWLPRHMTPDELNLLTELAALDELLSETGQTKLLDAYNRDDRAQLLDQATTRRNRMEQQLQERLADVYNAGDLLALISDVNERPQTGGPLAENLHRVARVLMDRRYPHHPHLSAQPKKQDLELLLCWLVNAGAHNTSVAFSADESRVLQTLGVPLELVHLGQGKASLRVDSRYLKLVLQLADQDSVSWSTIADRLRDEFGFEPLLQDLFLCFLCARDHRALHESTNEPVEVRIGMPTSARIRLQRGQLVSTAEWHRLRDLAQQLFGLAQPPAQRSLHAQDALHRTLFDKAVQKRQGLQGVRERIQTFDIPDGARLDALATAHERLRPQGRLTPDSYNQLRHLLAAWPDRNDDPLRVLVQQIDLQVEALDALDATAYSQLRRGLQHATLGPLVHKHLDALHEVLRAEQQVRALSKAWVQGWNQEARALVDRLLEQLTTAQLPPTAGAPVAPSPGTWATDATAFAPAVGMDVTSQFLPSHPPMPGVPAEVGEALLTQQLDPSDPDAVSDFLAAVRRTLGAQPPGPLTLTLRKTEPS